jgi:CubicO group peptidase (beta-lactamase class C family)
MQLIERNTGLRHRSLPEIRKAISSGEYGNIHGVVALHAGRLAAEWYFQGPDERLGRQLGPVQFNADTSHDIRSTTKSIVSLLFGIALSEGAIGGIDESLEDCFRDYAYLLTPEHSKIRLKHLLSMTSGIRWDERTYPYTDPRNSETAMSFADDRLQMILSQPVEAPPGERFNYSGGDVELIASIIARRTRTPLVTYARKKLFEPLGIDKFEWLEYRDGAPIVASGLRMRPLDMAKLGQLVLQNGVQEGVSLIPQSWIRESTSFKAQVGADRRCGRHYGYLWWLEAPCKGDHGVEFTVGMGNGGQRIVVVPDLGIVVVTVAGFYNKFDGPTDELALALVSALRR